jgi:hypothetical protein
MLQHNLNISQPENYLIKKVKIGRNEPCPYGSCKKFEKRCFNINLKKNIIKIIKIRDK